MCAEAIDLLYAGTYREAAEVALQQMARQHNTCGVPLAMVCGPISTGGLGDIDANLARFEFVVTSLFAAGYPIFSQIPYEKTLHRIRAERVKGKEYDMSLLTEFYLPLFESGMVGIKYFIPGWESSRGARWERDQATRLGIAVVDLGDNLLPG